MESNTPEINPFQDDVENAIKILRSILNNNYLTAEKLMSLRNPEIKKSLNESVTKVEDSYDELMKLMASNMTPSQTIADVATNKREFDDRINDWFTRTGTMGSTVVRILPVLKPRPLAQLNLVEAHGLLLSRLGDFKPILILNRCNYKLTTRENGRKSNSVSYD